MLQTLPRERLLLETDCPYLGPEPGTRNEPRNVSGTLAYTAELWNTTYNDVLMQFQDNYAALFGVEP